MRGPAVDLCAVVLLIELEPINATLCAPATLVAEHKLLRAFLLRISDAVESLYGAFTQRCTSSTG